MPPVPEVRAMTQVAGVIALVALAAVVASLGYLHLEPTGLSPVRNAVSQYGITTFRAGYRVATIAFGVAGTALAVGVDEAVSGDGRKAVVALLVLFSIARGAISWFPIDRANARASRSCCLRERDVCRLQARERPVSRGEVAILGDGVVSIRLGHGRLPPRHCPRSLTSASASAIWRHRARFLPLGDSVVRGVRIRMRCECPLIQGFLQL
jgi:hypothetical protein